MLMLVDPMILILIPVPIRFTILVPSWLGDWQRWMIVCMIRRCGGIIAVI
jgi:hypothetical protein